MHERSEDVSLERPREWVFIYPATERSVMAATNDSDGPGLRTVTPPSDEHDDSQMNAVGWIIFGLLAILLLPLAPIAVLLWLYSKLTN